ncbi:MAG: GIY-YIG nuclease family protein [Candidatus Marinimicrobia bacterium]|nr:GIY-YIG nuclease family protein [Candidatus Neomarinimicrobiota bacterium]
MRCKNFIKIGIAKDICTRLSELQVGNPFPVFYVWSSRSLHREDAHKIEKMLHHQFAHSRERGEWFKMNPEGAIKIAERLYASYAK